MKAGERPIRCSPTRLVEFIRDLPGAAPGKKRYAELLAASGLHDDLAFLRLLARELCTDSAKIFRELDPQRLIFGERHGTFNVPKEILEEAAKVVDVISVQPYEGKSSGARYNKWQAAKISCGNITLFSRIMGAVSCSKPQVSQPTANRVATPRCGCSNYLCGAKSSCRRSFCRRSLASRMWRMCWGRRASRSRGGRQTTAMALTPSRGLRREGDRVRVMMPQALAPVTFLEWVRMTSEAEVQDLYRKGQP